MRPVYRQLKRFACGEYLGYNMKNVATVYRETCQKQRIMYFYVAQSQFHTRFDTEEGTYQDVAQAVLPIWPPLHIESRQFRALMAEDPDGMELIGEL